MATNNSAVKYQYTIQSNQALFSANPFFGNTKEPAHYLKIQCNLKAEMLIINTT